MIFRTTLRDTRRSRQISLIGFFCTKNARRIFAIVPQPAFQSRPPRIKEANVDPQPRGPDWMQITPKAGSLFHANSHSTHNRGGALESEVMVWPIQAPRAG